MKLVRSKLRIWAKAAKAYWGDKFTIQEREFTFHTGRHAFATNMLETGASDLFLVSKLLGHKSIQSTQVYAHVREQRKIDAVSALPKLIWE